MQNNFTDLDLNSDFTLFENMRNSFFNPQDSNYALIKHADLWAQYEEDVLNENTFYSNRKEFITRYCLILSRNLQVRLSSHQTLFYRRLEKHLFPLCQYIYQPPSNPEGKKVPAALVPLSVFVQHLRCNCLQPENILTTAEFYPYFVGLICSMSKANDWTEVKENIIAISSQFLNSHSFTYPSNLSVEDRDVLIKYWLELTFPNELNELINLINRELKKEIDYSTYRFLKINFSCYLDSISQVFFITRNMQQRYLIDASEKVINFFNNRKKGDCIFEETTLDPTPYIEAEIFQYAFYQETKCIPK